MAGSRGWRPYFQDGSISPNSILIDESNAEGSWVADLLVPTGNLGEKLPRGFKPRRVNTFLADNSVIKRQFIVGNPALFAQMRQTPTERIIKAALYPRQDGSDADGGELVNWVITSFTPERYGLTPQNVLDTGLDDGDAEN